MVIIFECNNVLDIRGGTMLNTWVIELLDTESGIALHNFLKVAGLVDDNTTYDDVQFSDSEMVQDLEKFLCSAGIEHNTWRLSTSDS